MLISTLHSVLTECELHPAEGRPVNGAPRRTEEEVGKADTKETSSSLLPAAGMFVREEENAFGSLAEFHCIVMLPFYFGN